MGSAQFYWRDFVLVVVGVALIAYLQADFVESSRAQQVLRPWIIHVLFGGLYALIGSATTFMAVTRQQTRR